MLSSSLRRLISILLCGTVCLGAAMPFDQYLRVRKQHGISQAAGVEALETLVGSRTVEIQGTVKGAMRVNGKAAIFLEKSDGETMVIDAAEMPEWLVGNEVRARLIIRATRAQEQAPLSANMLGAAPESRVAQWEAREAARKAAAPPKPPAATPQTRKAAREWNLPAADVTPIYAAFIKRQNRRLTDAQAMHIAQGIVGFSIRFGVDARLIMAMVMVESGFNPSATSRAGAMGLGQLMPGTARWMGVSNAYDTTENLYGTVKLVRTHLDDYQRKTGENYRSLVLTLAAYNAGMGAVRRHGGVPPFRETQNYVRKVMRLYNALSGRS
jgi:soluble lytic murein transglycosylase-like protein